ncbi:MAG TPA: VOC family protein [Alphaproteobacteria bacterium]|nr:VOC family protein [Alphaproteobacteria bacterium]
MPSRAPARFAFTKLIVSDVDRLFAFYRDVFGLTEIARVRQGEGNAELDEIIMVPDGAGYSVPSLVIQRYPNRPIPSRGEATLGFMVADLEKTLEVAIKAGASIDRPARTASEHGIRVAFIKDTDGHLIEVVQQL